MKKPIKYLLSIGFLSIIPILLLFSNYYIRLENISYNFKRKIPYHITDITKFDLKYNSFYIAGHLGSNLYLSNYVTTGYILKINTQFRDTSSLLVDINRSDLKTEGLYKTYIDSPNFYLFNGQSRTILKGEVGKWNALPDPVYTPYFYESAPISNNSIAFAYVSATTKQNSLRKESITGSRIENDKILEKQVDGLFCTSGILDFNKELKQLTYTYRFRNQILVIDTNLRLIKKLKTIDPIDSAKFIAEEIRSNNASVLTSPPPLVNANCASWKNYLFVQSRIMGKNEDEVLFKNSTVIDIYDLKKFKYVYSIYLPNENEKVISQFKIIDGYIFTITGHYIYRYKIQLPET